MKQSYPLEWPEGWPRTASEKRSAGRFNVSLAQARDELLEELRLLGAKDVVLSTAIPTRKDGLPYAGRAWRPGDDPGVVAYFTLRSKPKAIPCDAYRRPEANLRAIGLSIAAMRALDRHGVSGLLDRAFAGFDALPSPDQIDWRAELGFGPDEFVNSAHVQARHRELAKRNHPDVGGSVTAMARLNRARDLANTELMGGAS